MELTNAPLTSETIRSRERPRRPRFTRDLRGVSPRPCQPIDALRANASDDSLSKSTAGANRPRRATTSALITDVMCALEASEALVGVSRARTLKVTT